LPSLPVALAGAARERESRVPAPPWDVFHLSRQQEAAAYSDFFMLTEQEIIRHTLEMIGNKIAANMVDVYD
jgi:hypothetical protein